MKINCAQCGKHIANVDPDLVRKDVTLVGFCDGCLTKMKNDHSEVCFEVEAQELLHKILKIAGK